ncbi:LAMMER dual specificity kinase [Heracleum sosnowskyi]|uniref:LAMMER dual specificity kinase n=1 Tax=Heracleum sosnowskyi TaxID=360622 RepID=A0AAD8MAH8_9APIA|nr:LAMMER dual specificity kinase [Heracleum sosnowskyi]
MAVSSIEVVLQFLRENGLKNSESSLLEDIREKSDMGSDDSISPAPPALKNPMRSSKNGSGGSSDEFVSLASSTTDLCSSDFTNPYGIRAVARGTSCYASSDTMSQFGTARDYYEFDMQNEQYCYNERDDGYMPPGSGNPDSMACLTEDKFLMTSEMQNHSQNEMCGKYTSDYVQPMKRANYSDNLWPFDSMEIVTDGIKGKDYNHLVESLHLEGSDDNESGSDNKSYRDDPAVHSVTNVEQNEVNPFYFETTENKDFGRECCEDETGREESGATDDKLIPSIDMEEYEVFNLRIIHRKNRTGFEELKNPPIMTNSVIAGRYYVTQYIGSATFSEVVQARDLLMGVDVCLKIIKNNKDFFDQSLDEIKLLKFVNKHDPADQCHILRLYDYFYYKEHLIIVSELLQANLYEFQKCNRQSGEELYFTMNRLQDIARQCLEALDYLHGLGIIHCDLKPENILIKNHQRCEIKVIDLGSSCFLTDNLSLHVQSRSYRAPEVILGNSYNQKIDIWSLGCILAELYSGRVLFPDNAITMLLARMICLLGPFDVEMLETGQETDKYFTKDYDLYHIIEETNQLECIILEESTLEHHLQINDARFGNFLRDLLEINPLKRLTAKEALQHPWLSSSYGSDSS